MRGSFSKAPDLLEKQLAGKYLGGTTSVAWGDSLLETENHSNAIELTQLISPSPTCSQFIRTNTSLLSSGWLKLKTLSRTGNNFELRRGVLSQQCFEQQTSNSHNEPEGWKTTHTTLVRPFKTIEVDRPDMVEGHVCLGVKTRCVRQRREGGRRQNGGFGNNDASIKPSSRLVPPQRPWAVLLASPHLAASPCAEKPSLPTA